MRMLLILAGLGAGAYALIRRRQPTPERPAPAAFASDQSAGGTNPVRDAGPEAMRDAPQNRWSRVDQASDESFPASDPPATY
ncbi:hypothetical protein A9D12_02345 [Erythrobacter neustonensis]|uniref:Uncharacterized protein n=2 Tax=Erythrobacter neustonensis TaxID=1112 RepID=A0A192D0D0_9SPHN|nr:hypothetical protein [Erythrobacter neustonensis]ANK11963.1 hypothetical protein A9D12_02345 [Erythrobacter neustonensis]